jgi:pyruvate formate lyase activating enzyme
MNIRGFIETSLLDWDGKITAVVFLGGCNFRCQFCQNYPLVSESELPGELQWHWVKRKIETKKKWLDGVVVSGGEPTIQPELDTLLREIKNLGLLTKLDTNGSEPGVLKKLFDHKLVDYVAMDIKTSLDERYAAAVGTEVSLGDLLASIRLITESDIDYEFRTTLVPGIVGKREIQEIVKCIQGARSYVLQQFVPENAYGEKFRQLRPYSRLVVKDLVEGVQPWIKETGVRGKFE